MRINEFNITLSDASDVIYTVHPSAIECIFEPPGSLYASVVMLDSGRSLYVKQTKDEIFKLIADADRESWSRKLG